MPRYDFDLFTIGAGSGGVAGSRRAGAYGARVAICEEAARRRHLRAARLRAEKAAGLRRAIRRRLCRRRRLWLDGAAGELRLAEPDRRQGQGARPPVADLRQHAEEQRRSRSSTGAASSSIRIRSRSPASATPPTTSWSRSAAAPDGAEHPRHRACDLVERGARPAEPAAPHRHRRRRLYRGRVRRHLQRLRQRGRRDHPRARSCSTASTTMSASPWRRRCAAAASRSTPAPRSRASTSTARGLLGLHDRSARRSRPICVMYATGRKPEHASGLGLAEVGVEINENGAVVGRRMAASALCRTSTRSAM